MAENTAADLPVGSPVTATDPDPNSDALDYTLSGADAGFFSVGADDAITPDVDETGQIMVKSGTKLDYETKRTYSVTLKAADSFGDYDTIDVTIMVTQVNEAPPVMGEATVEYAENGAGPVATYTAVDPEGTAVKWSLLAVVAPGPEDDSGDFSISGGVLSFKKSPNYEAATGGGPDVTDILNTYSVTVVATDATRRASMKAVTVNVTNVDELGTVKLTTLAPRAGIALTASVSDPDSPAPVMVTGAVWQWAKSRNGTSGWGDIDKATSATYAPADGVMGYYLRATVTYKDRESVRDTKTAVGVSANAVKATRSQNEAPEFPDQNLDEPGDQSGTATREVAENTAAGEAIGDPVVATDGDDDILTYTLTGTDAGHFAIDWDTGQLRTKGKLDFDGDGVPMITIGGDDVPGYTVVVRATDPDGKPEVTMDAIETDNSDVITVTISVTDVDEAPEFTEGESSVSFEENGAITEPLDTYVANDPETEDVPTFSKAGADSGKFTIILGDLKFMASPDYEKPGDANKDNVYEVTVQAKDGVGNIGMKTVKVTVTNVEEAGTVTLAQLQPRVGVAITASVTDLDGDVSGVTWQWSRNASQNGGFTDIEKATSATYKPVGDDAGDVGMFLKATAMYTDGEEEGKTANGTSANAVALDTRNRAPVFDDQDDDTDGVQNEVTTRKVGENTKAVAVDDVAGEDDQPADNVGAAVTATDSDPDEDGLGYTLEGADAARFAINRTTGQIEVGAGTKLDYETKVTYMVTVRVTDSFGDSDTIAVTITVTPKDEAPVISVAGVDENQPPVFPSDTDTRSVVEGTAAGADIGAPVTAEDSDVGDALTYTLGGTDAASFNIVRTTGQLQTKADLDYETKASYAVTVTATDAAGLSDSIDVAITVADVDENIPPEFPGETDTRSVVEGTAADADIGAPVTAEDPDVGDALSYTLSGTDAASFDIDRATGQLKTKADLDYETKASYAVTVTATDAAGLSDAITVTINVTAVDENIPPEFPSAATTREVAENTVAGEDIGAPVAASDANDAALSYTLSGTDAASFDIDRATGQLKTKADLDYETRASYSVTVTATDAAGLSDSIDVAITVADVEEAGTGDPLADKYDANDNGEIERAEVFAAIDDYLDGDAGAPTRADVFKLIELYLGD